MWAELLAQAAALALCPPLVLGVIQRTKARAAGRRGPPLAQPYRDLAKLLRKGAVRSRTTSWVFAAGPLAALVTAAAAALLVPLGGPAPLAFAGDWVLCAALFGLGRFAAIAAALDSGSAFGGMGASREAALAALAEPALFLALLALVALRGELSLSALVDPPRGALLAGAARAAAPLALVCAALFAVLLAENGRMPFDDPSTHLELTMIHEVMLLDHGGPLLGAALLGAAQQLFLQSALLVRVALPLPDAGPLARWAVFLCGVGALAVAIGLVESALARLRLRQLPMLLLGASLLAGFGIVLGAR